jgi:hypothetical protein
MNWLMKLIFPSLNTRVRIDSGNLPGLKPPTISPIRPRRKEENPEPGPDLDGMFKRYKASPVSKNRHKGKKGFDL